MATTDIYTLSLHDALPICDVINNFIAIHFNFDTGAAIVEHFRDSLRLVVGSKGQIFRIPIYVEPIDRIVCEKCGDLSSFKLVELDGIQYRIYHKGVVDQ